MQPPTQIKSVDTPRNSLVLIGSSARAAAFDAKLAGFKLLAVDRFGDEDLVAICEQWILYDDQQEWLKTTTAWPDSPIVPVGGFSWESLQKCPTFIGLDLRTRLLAYPSEATLAELNSPNRLTDVAKVCGIAFPETWELKDERMVPIAPRCLQQPAQAKYWLIKPRKHAGGVGIRRCNRTDAILPQERRQWMVPGRPIGANFIATGQPFPIKAIPLGVFGGITYRRNKSQPYLYGGSYGPLQLPNDISNRIDALGQAVAETFSLRGLFNIDLILSPDQSLWLLEVNPRYSASMELVSRRAATKTPANDVSKSSLIDLHLGCYQNRDTIVHEIEAYKETLARCSSAMVSSKRIVYAKQDVIHPRSSIKSILVDEKVCIADLPNSDLRIRAGEPICTVICSDQDTIHLMLQKSARAARLVRATCVDHH